VSSVTRSLSSCPIAAFREKGAGDRLRCWCRRRFRITDVPARVQDRWRSQGVHAGGGSANVTLTRAQRLYPWICSAYEGGDLSQNWLSRTRRHQHRRPQTATAFFVMGEVRLQQAKQMVKRRMTLPRRSVTLGAGPHFGERGKIYVTGATAAPEFSPGRELTGRPAAGDGVPAPSHETSCSSRHTTEPVEPVMSQICLRCRFCTTRRSANMRLDGSNQARCAALLRRVVFRQYEQEMRSSSQDRRQKHRREPPGQHRRE